MLPKQQLIELTNANFNVFKLLEYVGLHNPHPGQLVYCPFHDDTGGGKKSGKLFGDALHCFSENKQYKSYDILRFIGWSDLDIERALRSVIFLLRIYHSKCKTIVGQVSSLKVP